jgi:hypothetical protein
MENTTDPHTPDIFDGDLKLQVPHLHTGPAPGRKREPSFFENFPRFYNRPARCHPRRPFEEYLKS